MVIKRTDLRSQVRDELLDRMRSGIARPGETINEVQLAAELGVSRTPLREALIALASEGQLASVSGRGFWFLPLSARELEELATVMAALEGLALELSPVGELMTLAGQLAALADEFTDEVATHAMISQRDDEWHLLMLSACPNRRLLDMVASTRAALHRYESLLVHDQDMVARSSSEHAKIAERLAARDVSGAKEALRLNWVNGSHRLIDRLEADTEVVA